MKQTESMSEYDGYRKTKKYKRIFVTIAITIGVIGIIIYFPIRYHKSSYETIVTSPDENQDVADVTTPSVTQAVTIQPEPTQEVVPTQEVTPILTPETITEAPKPTTQGKKDEYDYSQPVPETAPVEDSYFSDAIFIGNSRTQGFLLYSGLTNVKGYASRGLMVNSIFKEKFVKDGDVKVTVFDALKKETKNHKIYLMLGVNELGWKYSSMFRDGYLKVIDEIRSIAPDSQIYIQSILPVTKDKSESDAIYNKENIDVFNELLRELCKEQKVYYINVAEAVEDEEGYLPKDAAFDGVHLKKEYCKKWLAYLKTHTVNKN